MSENKNAVRARISEIELILKMDLPDNVKSRLEQRKIHLLSAYEQAPESIMQSVIRSHKAICEAKKMDEKAAYGNDPSVYYSLAITGESGELANKIVRCLRTGYDREKILEAVKSELPDVVIYSYVLAYVLDIDLTALVNEKVDVVVKRARAGYYGGELPTTG
jgi:NTP pyrophosphatase (non-canonical NTP hydrolase)